MFQWDPGDGSDVVEGQDGIDTLLFNGSGANENFDLSANGGRIRFTRDVGNIVMDVNDVETVNVNALGGTDTVTVNDLSGTDITQVNINLFGTIGGTTGDAQARRGPAQGWARLRCGGTCCGSLSSDGTPSHMSCSACSTWAAR